jgi:hypothetical protein
VHDAKEANLVCVCVRVGEGCRGGGNGKLVVGEGCLTTARVDMACSATERRCLTGGGGCWQCAGDRGASCLHPHSTTCHPSPPKKKAGARALTTHLLPAR